MEVTSASLLMRIRNTHDDSAWGEFDGIYRPMIFRICRKCGLYGEEAEDVTQECMLKLSKVLKRFNYDPRKGRFRAFLQTMVQRRVRNALRRRVPAQAKSEDFRRPQTREPLPLERIEELFRREVLQHCLRLVEQEVDSSTIAAFKAYVIEERSAGEVCKSLDMTPNQLYGIKNRMLRKLREHKMTFFEGLD